MDKQTETILDNNDALQTLIGSPEWARDSIGRLANRAVRLCLAAGATDAEAYDYLEIDR